MFTKLRCFDCGEKVHLYLGLSEFSRCFCDNCALEFDSDEITKYVTERRDNHTLLGSAEAAEQIAEWKKVLDMLSDYKQKEARIEQLRRQANQIQEQEELDWALDSVRWPR